MAKFVAVDVLEPTKLGMPDGTRVMINLDNVLAMVDLTESGGDVETRIILDPHVHYNVGLTPEQILGLE